MAKKGVRILRGAHWHLRSRTTPRARTRNPIVAENEHEGSAGWLAAEPEIRLADDLQPHIKGYASATSVNRGDAIDFFVDVPGGEDYSIEVFRIGHYGGAGSRSVVTSPVLRGLAQKPPEIATDTRLISCDWQRSWRLDVPADWTSGYHLAVLTTTSGWRNYVPFVVRDDAARADFCVVIPFTTYQAYNQWPLDGVTGKSLYYGYDTATGEPGSHPLDHDQRSFAVSFDRPYSRDGMPKLADLDMCFIRWAEAEGYDLTYATSHDLHAGRIDPDRHTAIVFPGHDEYWSTEMRRLTESAVAEGTGLAFLSANNAYWHVRFETSAGGTPDRIMVCYKSQPDPAPGSAGATGRWRDPAPNPADPEQRLMGVMYNGIVAKGSPLVVRNAAHWLWAGTGVSEGHSLPGVVTGEGDGVDRSDRSGPARRVLLSHSPFPLRDGTIMIQSTCVCEPTRDRGMVFVAGALHWSWKLGRDGKSNPVIRRATANVLDRMIHVSAKRRRRLPHAAGR